MSICAICCYSEEDYFTLGFDIALISDGEETLCESCIKDLDGWKE